MFRVILASIVIGSLTATAAVAQEPTPPPEPIGRITLSERAPGAYQLEFHAESDQSPYVVSVRTSRIGTDQGVGSQLLEQSEPDFAVDLQLPLDGMTQEGCYRVGFWVSPKRDQSAFGEGASVETRGCVDASGATTFPAYDGVIAPPPPPPSDVRVVPRFDYWAIEWTDNSTDEVSFLPRIMFFDRPWADGGSQIATLTLPEVPANRTAAYGLGTGAFFFPDEPAERTCGYAMVLVFTIGPDSPSIWPGNTTVPACFGGRTLSFPSVGSGDASAGTRPALVLLVGLLASGAALMRCGIRVCSPRQRE